MDATRAEELLARLEGLPGSGAPVPLTMLRD
jgi:hypothetical protein